MRFLKFYLVLFVGALAVTSVSCSKEDDAMAQVRVNGTVLFEDGDDFNGDVDGDFTGTGGNADRTFIWNNSSATAEYNADITAGVDGSFRMVVQDAEGMIVLDRNLSGNADQDSFSGVTEAGVSGIWSVTITLTNFSGDGSFSLSQGN
ncbi:hypothetical protein [Zeaxanthinibacter enoshimensis]|uniref:Secreted protein n=1 Tax=Zeaxanthinibacter enoshimensis TaxID=392009 RepID=A0A4R6TRT5_9FLAO|nr:hypothetical protein [Zeaxanthinibacter enoshimensis]TDQ31200.1 hypothetical protein CLV82_1905 [Zeaxanthinibacter enoshimensis]